MHARCETAQQYEFARGLMKGGGALWTRGSEGRNQAEREQGHRVWRS